MNIHTLANGATIITLSPHPFRFSDGTVSEPQTKEVCDKFTLARKASNISTIKGMAVNATPMVLSLDQLDMLAQLRVQADIILLPFPMLTALREQGVRDLYPNCVAFNATQDTQRAAPTEKVVDINNWSY